MRTHRMPGAVKAALTDLQERLAVAFPTATFTTYHGSEPCGWYLDVTVDFEDTWPVIDAIIDPLIEYQVEQELPIYVVTSLTPELNQRIWERERARGRFDHIRDIDVSLLSR
jgi:hypothetical protein